MDNHALRMVSNIEQQGARVCNVLRALPPSSLVDIETVLVDRHAEVDDLSEKLVYLLAHFGLMHAVFDLGEGGHFREGEE